MKKSWIMILILAMAQTIYTQEDIKLPGVVVEQNSKFNTGSINYLSNVQVKAPGATPLLSNAKGKFTLVFADKPFGNVTRIYASKKGYEVVNDEELKKAAVLGRKVPLQVVFCKEGQLYENQVAYYKIARDAVLAAHKKRIDVLQTEGKERELLLTKMETEFNQKISSVEQANQLLENQLQKAEKKATELAERFVFINLDDQNESYQLAFKAFLKNDLEEALRILNSIDLKERLEINLKESQKEEQLITSIEQQLSSRRQQIEKDLQQCVFRARLHILNYDFDEADADFDLALKYDSFSPSTLMDIADYYLFRNNHDKSVILLNRALQRGISRLDSANIMQKLGISRLAIRELGLAHDNFLESKELYEGLGKKEAETSLPSLAVTLEYLAVTSLNKDSVKTPFQYLDIAEEIYDTLVRNDSIYFASIANLLVFRNALDIRPYDTPENIVVNLFSSIIHSGALDKYAHAIRFLENTNRDRFEISRRLNHLSLEQNLNEDGVSFDFLPMEEKIQLTLAMIKQNYAMAINSQIQQIKQLEARRIFSDPDTVHTSDYALNLVLQAGIIMQKLSQDNPQSFEPLLAQHLLLLSQCYFSTKQESQAINALKDSNRILERLTKVNQNLYLPGLAFGQYLLSSYYFHASKYDLALKEVLGSMKNAKLWSAPDQKTKDQLLLLVASRLNQNYATYLITYPDDLTQYRDSAISNSTIALRLSKKYPDLAMALGAAPGELEDSKAFFEEVDVDWLRYSGEITPLLEKAYKFQELGNSERAPDQKLLHYKKSLEYFMQLLVKIVDGRAQVQYDLANMYLNMAGLTDTLPTKVDWQSKGVSILKDLSKDHSEVKEELSDAKGNLSFYLILSKNFSEAIAEAQEALDLAPDKDWVYTNLALAYLLNGDFKKAKAIYTKYQDKDYSDGTKAFKPAFIQDLDTIEESGIIHPDIKKIRRLLKD